VHLAALTNVDRCEVEPENAHEINVSGTENVVRAAERARARVILVSTDYVFDGRSETPYQEDDRRSPLNVYGMTKAEAEDIVSGEPAGLTIRSSWVFGEGHNFVASVVAAARRAAPLRVVEDQRGIPTPAEAIARAIAFAIDQRLEGLLHVAGDGPIISWADLAQESIDRAGLDATVGRVTTQEYVAASDKTIAPRPAFSALDLTKAKRLGVPLLDWRAALDDYIERSL
jgi:dTDP-4-dehydrorhamnose reductase